LYTGPQLTHESSYQGRHRIKTVLFGLALSVAVGYGTLRVKSAAEQNLPLPIANQGCTDIIYDDSHEPVVREPPQPYRHNPGFVPVLNPDGSTSTLDQIIKK